MTIVMMDREQEKLELESLPEYIRESQAAGRETSTFARPNFVEREPAPKQVFEPEKSDELEALWPGVHQDFAEHGHRRAPSFYMMLGFMAGAVVSLVGVWGYSAVSHQIVAMKDSGKKEVVVAGNVSSKGQTAQGQAAPADAPSSNETLIPLTSVYEVQNGDTLAGIAYRNYKRVSPRLMDAICKANGMRNANVLSLGQKITLPEYHPQVSQIAATAAGQPQ